MSQNIAQLLLRAARIHPQRPALARGERLLASYAELAARVGCLAAGLAARLAPNDRVGLVMKNCPQYVELMFACWHAGLVAVPINGKLHKTYLVSFLDDASRLITHSAAGVLSTVIALAASLDPNSNAVQF